MADRLQNNFVLNLKATRMFCLIRLPDNDAKCIKLSEMQVNQLKMYLNRTI